MGLKNKLFYGSLFLHQRLARHFGGELVFVPAGYLKKNIVTQPMAYDMVSESMQSEYKNQMDYVRYRTIELIAEEIRRNNIAGDVAEAGVDYGDCSWIINRAFSDRKFYLYDTFSGFDKRDVDIEQQNEYTSDEFFESANYFKRSNFKTSDDQAEYVRQRLKHPENAIFRKGYFPETAKEEADKVFAFVSLDMDLYQPILNGIKFFYPLLNRGGYMMIHDYNHREFQGIKGAVAECEAEFGVIPKVPLPDQGGSIVLMKV
ncbi:MAG: TylF/MycF family methyltransferase [Butyrivibrio sp.]|nr:TylF/MycF family methyltransferase [Acetatifactor muris]MCM1559037.1 TylF/MycF family methyltransferase [Butyrivibrio sp.]